ncbi:zinc finger BED domain-containing protein RICESLEEPER 2-like [Phragmites australis]|uniref:zinc finger BED domain-containing protein RICESLEEPER 2-like n=1 Tax=Phragmites australis TaxID=29695 RepID=UPI002D775FFF|nr:zinc finger BED domain-containing protein RICESLEEPER 2-like [Phragmites australis]
MATPGSSSQVQASHVSGSLVPACGTGSSDEDINVVDVSEDEEVATAASSKRKLTSAVWNDFEKSWDLDRRVSIVTLDNCSTNDNMIGLMETRLGAANMLLKGKWLHMRCCAHILNLIVKDGMEVIGTAVAHIRESVAYWIATPKRKVFEHLGELDRNFVCPPENDWIFATTILCEIKLKINSWGHDEDETIRKMSDAMIEKYDKYWADIHSLMAVTVILDPRLKMTMLHACYIALFGEDAAEKYVTEAHQLLTDLMKHYQVKNQEFVSTSSSGASSSVGAAAVLSIFKTLAANKKTTSFVRSKNELDRYLDDETLPHDENDYFDVFGWWKLEGTRYPTLRLIARDILAIPITTVASESAFSTSERILSEHRSRLTPRMLEALMCSQSWLRHTLKDEGDRKFNSFWSCLEDIEEEMKEESCITTIDSD